MNVRLINGTERPEELVCPTCGDGEFQNRSDMRRHHSLAHGESIAKDTTICQNCGDGFETWKYRDRKYCSEKCRNEVWRSAYAGTSNHNWKPLVALRCEICDSVFEVPAKRQDEARFCSHGCANEWKKTWTGDNHHNWRGGGEPYYGASWQEVRRQVVHRDGECVSCGTEDARLEVHHIEPIVSFDDPEEANGLDNLVLLCTSCHQNVEHGNIECPEPEVSHAS